MSQLTQVTENIESLSNTVKVLWFWSVLNISRLGQTKTFQHLVKIEYWFLVDLLWSWIKHRIRSFKSVVLHTSCRSESSYYCFVIHNNFWIVKFIYNTMKLSDSDHLYWSVAAESIKSKQLTAVKSISNQHGKGDSEIKMTSD